MAMAAKAEAALRAEIAAWEEARAKEIGPPQIEGPLCTEFNKGKAGCAGCPVNEVMKGDGCGNIPATCFHEYCEAHEYDCDDDGEPFPEIVQRAEALMDAHIAFLKGLLPKPPEGTE